MGWIMRRTEPPHMRMMPRGFTLAESLIASVVLAVSVLAVGGVLAAASQQNSQSQQKFTALSLAGELMEEIIAQPVLNPQTGVATRERAASQLNRATYTHIGDYDGYTDATDAMTDRQGSAIPFYSGKYTRSVAVTCYSLPEGAVGSPITWTVPSASAPANAALVTVTVTAPDQQTVTISRLSTRYTLNGQ